MTAEGDPVAVRLTSHAMHSGEFMGMPASGKEYTASETHIFRIRDGKVAEHWRDMEHGPDAPARGLPRTPRRTQRLAAVDDCGRADAAGRRYRIVVSVPSTNVCTGVTERVPLEVRLKLNTCHRSRDGSPVASATENCVTWMGVRLASHCETVTTALEVLNSGDVLKL
ncbi:MAG: ester cyclase [Gaiellales bacterium]